MGILNAAGQIGLIFGPMVHGLLYSINKAFPFYMGSIPVYLSSVIVVFMMCKWPELRKPESKKDDALPMDNEMDWKYAPERVTKKDYMKLGKAFGAMLSDNNYHWVKYF